MTQTQNTVPEYDANDPFAPNPGTISWKGAAVGDSHRITLTGPVTQRQRRDADKPEILLWWDKECTQPKMSAVVTGTEDVDGESELVRLFVDIPSNLFAGFRAVSTELKRSLGAGDTVDVTFDGKGEATSRTKEPPNLFTVVYVTE